jgi:hypothetical protein
VTEAEGLAATDPGPMLEYLRGGGISARKRRLFACGCCRLLGPRLWGENRHAVEVAARTADGRATEAERQEAVTAAFPPHPYPPPEFADIADPRPEDVAVLRATDRDASHANALAAAVHAAAARPASQPRQAALLRELVGNPFRLPVTVDPAWLAWNDGTVRKLAAEVYEARDLARLPVLADALEDAGCADAEFLGHLREPGLHVRGCWALDLLLGKE